MGLISVPIFLLVIAALLSAIPLLSTRWRRRLARLNQVSLVLIALSLALGIYQERENIKAVKEAAETAQRTAANAERAADQAHVAADNARDASDRAQKAIGGIHKVVGELERVSQPLTRIRFDPKFRIPITDPAFRDYKARLDKGVDAYNELTKTARLDPKTGRYYHFVVKDPHMWDSGEWVPPVDASTLWIDVDHQLFPSGQAEPLLRALFAVTEIELAFYKNPIRPEDFDVGDAFSRLWKSLKKEPDLRIASKYERSPWCVVRVFDPQDRYRLGMPPWEPSPGEWEFYTDALMAVPDLTGAQLMITLGPLSVGDDMRAEYQRLRAAFELEDLYLRINNRLVALKAGSLKKHRSKEGHTFWEFRFATDEQKVFVPRSTVR